MKKKKKNSVKRTLQNSLNYILLIVFIVALVGIVSFVDPNGGVLVGQATAASCTDTDGGMTYTEKGTIFGGTWKTTGKAYTSKPDSCKNSTTIYEYYCSSSTKGFFTTQSCSAKASAGYTCSDGACIPPETNVLGSYNTAIKVSNSTTSSKNNISDTVKALQETKQTLYGFVAHDGTQGDDSAGYYWPQFLELLKETEGTGIKIFAVVPESHEVFEATRWGVDAESTQEEWANAHVEAAKEFSALSATYPHLVAFTIDDFSGDVCTPVHEATGADCYSVEDVQAITDATKTSNPTFKFWPTVYYKDPVINKAYILGIPYGYVMRSTEYAAMNFTFNLTSSPSTATLSFLYYDYVTGSDSSYDNLRFTVVVNNHTALNASLNDEHYFDYFNEDIAKYLTIKNEIVFKLSTLSDMNVYTDKLLYFMEPSLTVNGVAVTNWDVSSDAHASSATYTGSLYTAYSGMTISNEGKMLATSNEDYIINEAVDGILAPYDYRSSMHDANTFTALLTQTEDSLGSGDLIAVQYGPFFGYDNVDSSVLKEQLSEAKKRADGVLVWSYPLAVHYIDTPKKGVFGEYTSPSAQYPLLFSWPSYEGGIEGWYARYVSKTKHTGTFTATIYDSRTDGTDDVKPDYFVKEIYIKETGARVYSDGIPGNEGAEKVSFDVGSTPVTLVAQFNITDAFGNVPATAYFNITAANGTVLQASDFTFESGTTEDTYVDTYDAVVEAYK